MNVLFPPTEPYDTGFLQVSSIHSMYYEQSGNKTGKPVVYLHGGPGGGTSSDDRRYFDPKVYRIVLFDQRGAGKSLPSSCLVENTTWHLVSDIETLRNHLGIETWLVFGGSWGSTLALTYAIKYPSIVKGMILRGIFTLRRSEIEWFYQKGASHVFPEYWDDYLLPIPENEQDDLVSAYYRRLTGDDEDTVLNCARQWSKWECATSKLYVDPEMIAKTDNNIWALAFAKIEAHYFFNKGFFESDSWILDNIEKIKHIPGVIIQGRYDVVCPATTAWELSKRWGKEIVIVKDAGHSAKEKSIRSELIHFTNKFKYL